MVSAPGRRSQAKFAHQRGLSKRSACALIGVPRSTLDYELRQPMKDAPVMAAMRELSAQFPRFGYRRIHVYLERQGHRMGWDRAHRLWRLAGLQVPRKRPRRRVAAGRPRPLPATGPNQVWAYDFVFDSCANGQQLKCLTIIDEWTRECLDIDVQGSIRSKRVIEVLERLVSLHGAPRFLRSDNGPEFVSHAVLKWLKEISIDTAFIDPGKPWQNGADESFNGKLRDECLSAEWFRSRQEARAVIADWRRHYNLDRPHSSLGYLSPSEFKMRSQAQGEVATKEISTSKITSRSSTRGAARPPHPRVQQ
jgi:putative transposase